jgi:DNA polymerase V
MGAPYFKYERMLRAHRVQVFSSNYALYGDLSRRVVQVLARFAPALEIYSIDECFLDLSGLPQDLTAYALEIARTTRQWTGIPVSIGIAPTKTLAKIANRLAKKGFSPTGPVLDWTHIADPAAALAAVPVEEVWGIAQCWGERLRALGLTQAAAVREADPKRLRRHFGVVMERIALELRGVSCLSLETVPPPRKQILTSRSFGEKVSRREDLRAAVTRFAALAGEKLRAQGLSAQALSVFIQTSPFDKTQPYYANALTLAFDRPSQDSGHLIRQALRGLERLFRDGYAYQKAGVMLLDLVPAGVVQTGLFLSEASDPVRSSRLMQALDQINRRHGRQTVRFAGEGLSERWHLRTRLKSPAYTTRWKELPTVRAI